MHLYLPIAEISVNWLIIAGLGALVGFLSGMFGVGGGFLTTPLLIFYGIPPAIAVASAANQITGSSVSAVLAHWRRGGVDVRMAFVMIVGGLIGSAGGSYIFRALSVLGQLDFIISLLYVFFLGTIGSLMLRESLGAMQRMRKDFTVPLKKRTHVGLAYRLPLKMRFHKSRLYISALAPFALGLLVGILTAIMGIGGGFIMVPLMIYVLGMPSSVVVGTSLLQIIFTTSMTTVLNSVQTQSVDIVLAVLLLIGGVIGAQFGAAAAQKLRAEQLRAMLAVIVLGVAIRLAIGMTWQPDQLYSVFTDL